MKLTGSLPNTAIPIAFAPPGIQADCYNSIPHQGMNEVGDMKNKHTLINYLKSLCMCIFTCYAKRQQQIFSR